MIGRLRQDASGAAGVEMAMILPLALLLTFVTLEAGHFIWSEHKVVEAVRNGARFASRQPQNSVCPSQSATLITNVATLTRTGSVGGTTPVVRGWSDNGQVVVTYTCGGFVNTGIYTELGANGATVTVRAANLNYSALFGAFNVFTSSLRLNASTSAAVIGI